MMRIGLRRWLQLGEHKYPGGYAALLRLSSAFRKPGYHR
jgi:hypothetical protein